jgi:ABC-type multidrug transport system ATPase subunit
MANEAPAAIDTVGLTKDYGGGHGILELDLRVHPGEVFGFIGPNGAGKTTTIKLLMDLVRPDRGSARVFGLDCQRDTVGVKRISGYLPGELPQFPASTGGQIVELLANLRGGVDSQTIDTLAHRLDLDLGRRFRDYSHGNKQKLLLIQAFMHRPRLLVLDEPTLGLDPVIQREFRSLVREAAANGATVFLSSHVLSEVEQECDRIGIIAAGRLRRVGTMSDLRTLRIHRVVARLDESVSPSALEAIPGVSDVEVSDHKVACRVRGRMGPVLQALAPAGVAELDSQEMSLEEVFLAEYAKDARS